MSISEILSCDLENHLKHSVRIWFFSSPSRFVLCNGLSEEYRKATGDKIQWNAIRGLQNIVAHAYARIKLDVLWDVITTDIPELKQFCDQQISEAE